MGGFASHPFVLPQEAWVVCLGCVVGESVVKRGSKDLAFIEVAVTRGKEGEGGGKLVLVESESWGEQHKGMDQKRGQKS